MIEQGLFQKHIVGRDGFIWWVGQIVSDSWKDNIVGSTVKEVPLSNQEGFSYRYQVRIMGYHTADLDALPDDQLPWAGVMMPVTAGASSPDSAGATPKLRAGNFVYGFFLDGEDAQQPLIIGVLGYNQYTQVYKGPSGPFIPFMGHDPNIKVPSYTIRAKMVPEQDLAPGTVEGKTSVSRVVKQGETGGEESKDDVKELKDGIKKRYIPSPYACKNSRSALGVQNTLRNMIQEIEEAKASVEELWDDVEQKMIDVQKYILKKLKEAAKEVTGFISKLVSDVWAWIEKKISSALLAVYNWLDPVKTSTAGDAARIAMDLLACHFKKIINNLFKMVFKALKGIADRYINVPICAAESIMGALIGKIMGLVNGIVNAIMGPLESLFSTFGQALDIVGSVFQFLDDILSFLNCEVPPECPPKEAEEWAIWLGTDPEGTTIDAGNVVSKIKEFAGGVSDVVDPDNFDFDLDVDFSDIFSLNDCNTDAIFCGPPRVVFWGGSGKGATGNAIISAAGDILGVDIINAGVGYDDDPPFISFKDDCGKGYGGSGVVVTGPVSQGDSGEWFSDPDGTGIGVIGVGINESGFGYLSVADGSQGGDGRTWAEYNQTTLQHGPNGPGGEAEQGIWDTPYNGNELIPAYTGDVIRIPIGCKTQFFATDGKTHEVFGGSNFTVPSDGVLTAPSGCADSSRAGAEDGGYPVALYICEVDIINPGFGYQSGDKVVIEPDVGAEITPTFNAAGNLIKVEIVNGGEGFTEFPTIYIESETGFNAEIRARLCIDRITDELKVPSVQDKVISVVDCVGTV